MIFTRNLELGCDSVEIGYLDIYGVLHPGSVHAVDVHPPVHPHGVPAPIRGDGDELCNPLKEVHGTAILTSP